MSVPLVYAVVGAILGLVFLLPARGKEEVVAAAAMCAAGFTIVGAFGLVVASDYLHGWGTLAGVIVGWGVVMLSLSIRSSR